MAEQVEHDGGNVGIDVVPKINAAAWGQRIKAELDPTLNRAGRDAGRLLGDRISKSAGKAFDGRQLARAIEKSSPQMQAAATGVGRDVGKQIARAARAEIQARLKNLPEATVSVKVKVTRKSLERARQQIESLGPVTVHVNVDADTAAAMARLAALRTQISQISGADVNIRVHANTAGAQRALFMLGLQMAALSSIPLGATLAAGIGSIGAAATAAGVGVGGMLAVAIPGVQRISEALAAQKTAENQVATATRARTAAVNSGAIASAQAQLRVMQLAQAEQRVTLAQTAARQAQRDLNAARVEGARALRDMQNDLIGAGLSLRADELAVLRAKQSLDQLNSSREDALAVQKAQVALAKADAGLKAVEVDPKATQLQKDQAKLAVDSAREALRQAVEQRKARALERKEAQLAYEQAVHQLRTQRTLYERLREDEAKARKAGVEGTEQVVQAKQRLNDALRQVADAQQAVRQQQIQDRIAALQQADAQRQAASAADGASAATVRLGRAMEKLTPAERELLQGWQSFSKIYREWVNDLEPDVLPVLAGGLGLVAVQLDKFSPMIRSSSAAFRILETRAALALDGPFYNRFIARMSIEAPRAIEGFGVSAGNTLTGVAGIFDAFLPYTGLLVDEVDDLTSSFARWGMSLRGSTGFIHFMGYVQQTGPQVLSTLGSLGSGLIDVGVALAPLGGALLTGIRLLADGLAAVADNAPGLLQMAAAALLVSKAVKVLGLTSLIAGLAGTTGAATAASAGMLRFGMVLRTVGGYMMGVSGAAVTTRVALMGLARLGAVVGVLVGMGYALNELQHAQKGTVQSTEDLTKSMRHLAETGEFTGAFFDQFKAGALSGKSDIEEFHASAEAILDPSWTRRWIDHPAAEFFHWLSFGTWNTPLAESNAKFKQLDATLTQMAEGGQAEAAASAFAHMAQELQDSGLRMDRIKTLFPQYNALVSSGAFQTQLFTQKIKEQNQALLQNANAFMSDERQVIDFNNALAAGRAALNSNGRAFWGNSQAALNNRSTLLQAAQVLNGYSRDLVENNRVTDASIKRIRSQRDQLVEMAQKFGLSRKEAEEYVDQLVKIPKRTSTSVSVNAKGKFAMKGLDNLGPISNLLEGVMGNAGGGYIAGSGGPRDDGYLTRISAGEMVVNAPATAKYLPFLAAINDEGNQGTIYQGSGYTSGGAPALGPAPSGPPAFAGGGVATRQTDAPEAAARKLPAFAGGGLYKPSYTNDYRYNGESAATIGKAREGNVRGIAGMLGYAVGQTAIGATIIAQLLSGAFGTGAKAVRFAQQQLGEPYVWGATGPNSWDCSGLTQAAWRAAGVNIPRVTYDQIAYGSATSKSKALPGDLYFPHRGHVMMVTGMGGDHALIHAPQTGDVVRYAGWRGGGTYRHIAGGGGGWYGGGTPKAFAKAQLGELGWGGSQWGPLEALWQRESNWRWNAENPSSGAYGIPQALPPGKMASFGSDWKTNWATQIRWGLDYIKKRYGSPSGAWAHSQRTGWYADGTDHARRGLAWVGERGPELVDFRGGEAVYPHEESLRMAAAAARGQVEVLEPASAAPNEFHAHFDEITDAGVRHQVRTAFTAMQMEQAQSLRIGRRN
ncbi:NlpC/P60 family protein [Actinomadura sp. LOL_016]